MVNLNFGKERHQRRVDHFGRQPPDNLPHNVPKLSPLAMVQYVRIGSARTTSAAAWSLFKPFHSCPRRRREG